MVNVYVVYDQTWNIMLSPYFGAKCLGYGTADHVDQWLEDNKNEYKET